MCEFFFHTYYFDVYFLFKPGQVVAKDALNVPQSNLLKYVPTEMNYDQAGESC